MSSSSLHWAVLGFAVAFGLFTLVFASTPSWGGDVVSTGAKTEGEANMRVVTDREWYYVGESGVASLEYYNPTTENIVITPPLMVSYHTDQSEIRVVTNISWSRMNFTLKPGDTFPVGKYEFTALRVGKLTIVGNDLEKTVEVLPRKP